MHGYNHPSVARELNNLGLAWEDLGEPQKAFGHYEQALAIDRAVYGNNRVKSDLRMVSFLI